MGAFAGARRRSYTASMGDKEPICIMRALRAIVAGIRTR